MTPEELFRMASAADEMHHEAMRTFRAETAGASAHASIDVDLAVYAQSVELAAVAVYMQVAGALSDTMRPLGALFASHHQDHANAYGAAAGDQATRTANTALLAAITPLVHAVTDEASALELAFVIENQAAATYAFALTVLSTPAAIAAAATILPVEAAHAALLGVALEKAPADIFPNGAFEAASVGEAGNSKTGLDPNKYPTG